MAYICLYIASSAPTHLPRRTALPQEKEKRLPDVARVFPCELP